MYALPVTLGVFALILILARLKVPLILAVLAGAVVLGPLFGRDAAGTAEMLLASALQPKTVALAAITILLLMLSGAMQAGGQLQRIVNLTRQLLRRPATAMIALPALIGLLPMPGGALFSAPMVAEAAGHADDPQRSQGSLLSAINYWFRHPWEYFWPLYPGVILAMSITAGAYPRITVPVPGGTWSLPGFPFVQMPLSLAMLAGGWLIVRRVHPDLQIRYPKAPPGTGKQLLMAVSPIWMILLIWVPAGLLLGATGLAGMGPWGDAAASYLPLVIGLAGALVWTVRLTGLGAKTTAKVLAAPKPYLMALLVLAVMVFKGALEDVGAAAEAGAELTALGVPLLLVTVLLPFISGMVTGLAIGFVGTSFPIVLSSLPPDAPATAYMVLAYASGHIGQMLSPLHLCHIMSNRYFQTGFGGVYRHILPAAAVSAAGAAVYALLLGWLS